MAEATWDAAALAPELDGDACQAAVLISRLRALEPHGDPHTEYHWGPPRQAWLSRRGQIWFAGAEGEPPTPFLGGVRVWKLEVEPAKRRAEAIAAIREEPVHALRLLLPNAGHSRKRYLAACDMKTRDQWVTACKSWAARAASQVGGGPSPRGLAPGIAGGATERKEDTPLPSLPKKDFSVVTAEGAVELRVLGVGGLICKIEAKGSWTVLDIKAEVTRIVHIPWLEQRLFFEGEELQDAAVLSSLPSAKSGLDLLLIRRSPEQAFWTERLGHDGQALFAAPESIRADREAVLAAVRSHGNALRCAEPRLQADRQIVLEAVRQSGLALAWADEDLRSDREVVLEAVRSHPSALVHAAKKFSADREVAMEVLKRDTSLFGCMEESLRADRDVVLAAVRRDGAALEYAAPALRADLGLVLQAVQSNGRALEHAAPPLRSDREIVMEAVKRNPHLLALASPALQKDEHLLKLSQRRPPSG